MPMTVSAGCQGRPPATRGCSWQTHTPSAPGCCLGAGVAEKTNVVRVLHSSQPARADHETDTLLGKVRAALELG